MTKIHIVFVIGTLELGGTERQFLELVSRLDPAIFEIEVVAFSRRGPVRDALEALKIPIIPLGFSAPKGRHHPDSYRRLIRLFIHFVRIFRQKRPHIVQSYLLEANIISAPAAGLAGVPVIITGRRTVLDDTAGRLSTFFERWLQNISNLWAGVVIANAEHVKQQCLRQECFLSTKNIRVIHNGIECERYQASLDTRQKRRALGLSEHGALVGMFASFTPCKGHQDVIRAAAEVLRHYPDTLFLFMGRDAGIQAELENLGRRSAIQRSLVFLGERRDIPEMLATIDIQVSSSYVEGLSNAVLEGMSAGKAIVATQIPGNMELLEHERTGLLVPPGDVTRLASAIVELLGNPEKRTALGEAARQKAETEFRMDTMVEKTANLYAELLGANVFPSRYGTIKK